MLLCITFLLSIPVFVLFAYPTSASKLLQVIKPAKQALEQYNAFMDYFKVPSGQLLPDKGTLEGDEMRLLVTVQMYRMQLSRKLATPK